MRVQYQGSGIQLLERHCGQLMRLARMTYKAIQIAGSYRDTFFLPIRQ